VRDRLEKAMNAGEDVADLWKAEKEKIDRIDARNRKIRADRYISASLRNQVEKVIQYLTRDGLMPEQFLRASYPKVSGEKVKEVLENFQASALGATFREKEELARQQEESDSLQNMRVSRKRRANH